MENLWWLWGSLAGVVTATYILYNQQIKMGSALFMVYRGVGLALVMLPFSVFFPFNPGMEFWSLCVITGLIIAYSDNRFFNVVSKCGAEVGAALQPLSIGITFFMWFVFKPSQIIEYWHMPLRFLIVLLCLSGFTWTIMTISHNAKYYRALKYLLPSLFLCSVIDNLQKVIMDCGIKDVYAASFYYIMITSFFAGLGNLVVFIRKNKDWTQILFNSRNLSLGMLAAAMVAVAVAVKNFGMAYTPNPAYIAALIFLYPVWIKLMNNVYIRYKSECCYERVSPKLLLLLLCSVIGLILFGRPSLS